MVAPSRLGLFLLAFGLAIGASCATSKEASKTGGYSMTAKQNYDKALAALKEESWIEAQKTFAFVKQKFPFSKYAVLAELGVADARFGMGNYIEAADGYKTFIRLHPTHEHVEDGYAAFRVGECYFRDMPGDVFILPPAYEKDQSAVRDALRELDDFIRKYPESKYVKDAEKLRRDVLDRLVEHEVYVARFYLDRDHPKAAVRRLEAAIRRYPGSGREPELLLTLGETYLRMGNPARARSSFQRVLQDYGAAHQARRAQLYLDFIKQRYGDVPPEDAHHQGNLDGVPSREGVRWTKSACAHANPQEQHHG